MTNKEQHRQHLIDGVGDKCLVCDSELIGYWTDMSGQIKCRECGTTYQILGCHLGDEFLAEMNLTKSQVAERYCDCFSLIELLRDYWQATKGHIPLGCYMGGGETWTQQQAEDFYRWIAERADTYQPLYPDAFEWDRMKEAFGHAAVAT